MSLSINIIIPVPLDTRLFDQTHTVMILNRSLSPQKEQKRQDTIIWKKSISAFKKFRQKRERRQLRKDSQNYGNAYQQFKVQKQYIKLLRRSKKDMENDAQTRLSESPKSLCGYFDPNIAPLYQYNLSQALQLNEKMIRENCSTKQMEGQYHEIKNQRIQSQIGEQFIPVEVVIEPRDDDPFFIIRRQSISKRSRTLKTKLIKKSEGQKFKGKGSNILYSIQKTESGQKKNNINLNHNIRGLMSKVDQSMSESEQEYQRQRPIGGKRQIETLQQILRFSQQNQQISQLFKSRETIIIKESLSGKQKFQII